MPKGKPETNPKSSTLSAIKRDITLIIAKRSKKIIELEADEEFKEALLIMLNQIKKAILKVQMNYQISLKILKKDRPQNMRPPLLRLIMKSL